MSITIIKGTLNWKWDRSMECQSFGSFQERSIVVSNGVLPGLVFSTF